MEFKERERESFALVPLCRYMETLQCMEKQREIWRRSWPNFWELWSKVCTILWKSRGRVISGINRRPFCGPLCPGRLELSWSFLGRRDPRGRMELIWEWTRRACSIISLSISLYGGRPENGPRLIFHGTLRRKLRYCLILK